MKEAVVKGTEHNGGHFTVMLVNVIEGDPEGAGS